MKISRKLSIIVLLTVLEVSVTIGAALEISKGGRFHQLNFLHLKYNALFSQTLTSIDNGGAINTQELIANVNDIRQQPVDCLELVNVVDVFIMKSIGTYFALDLCRSDIVTADNAIRLVGEYQAGAVGRETLLEGLHAAEAEFHAGSAEFEAPVAKTVSFILRTMVPIIIVISLFNIAFITYLSRTISSSIRNAIMLLSGAHVRADSDLNSQPVLTGELGELYNAARERVKADGVNQEVRAALEYEVQKRTESLQLANTELAEFAYRASHDLKAPLSSSKGLARFVALDIEAGDLEEAKKNVSEIRSQMERLEKLVVGILSLTRAEHDSTEVAQHIDLPAIIALSRDRLLTAGVEALDGIEIITNFEFKTPLFAEKARVTQIIENLLSNAIKYKDSLKARSFVKIDATEDSQFHRIKVEDNGLGIPEDRQGEVFLMFKRFHVETGAGTGLGLSIVKKHVDCMGATINFSSSSEGTTFTIHIPKRGE